MNISVTAHSKVPAQDDRPEKLMVSGLVYLEREDGSPVEVRRDMTILTREDQIAGKVAAVVIDSDSPKSDSRSPRSPATEARLSAGASRSHQASG
jgi:hypothetical protein